MAPCAAQGLRRRAAPPYRTRTMTMSPRWDARRAHYDFWVSGQSLAGGVVHELPTDLRAALLSNATALDAWNDITPLARNEFICWVRMPSRRPPERAGFGERRRNWRNASVGPAAGPGASTETARASSASRARHLARVKGHLNH